MYVYQRENVQVSESVRTYSSPDKVCMCVCVCVRVFECIHECVLVCTHVLVEWMDRGGEGKGMDVLVCDSV